MNEGAERQHHYHHSRDRGRGWVAAGAMGMAVM